MSDAVAITAEEELSPYPVRRWSVDEYMQFTQFGFLDEDDNLELLEGWIVPKMSKNPLHDGTVDRINLLFAKLMPQGWYVRTQNVLLTADSAPEPDLVVVRGAPTDYLRRHPNADDVALVIEVADSSLARDRLKSRLYARAGVTSYWVVNLINETLIAYSDPTVVGRDAMYATEETWTKNDHVVVKIPGAAVLEVAVSELVP